MRKIPPLITTIAATATFSLLTPPNLHYPHSNRRNLKGQRTSNVCHKYPRRATRAVNRINLRASPSPKS